MVASWASRYFSGVARAELTRRLALLSGETFHGRLPNGNMPNTNTVTIAENQKNRILDSAFHGNTVLHTLNIPASISTIGDFAFLGATGLRVINNLSLVPQQINDTTFATIGTVDNVQNSTPNQLDRRQIIVNIPFGTRQAYIDAGWRDFILVETLGTAGLIFSGTTLTGFNPQPNFDGRLLIPNGVTQIAPNALANFVGNRIVIPSSVTSIGNNVFASTIAMIELATGRTIIQDGLFANTGVSSVFIPTSVTHIGNHAFYNTDLRQINLDTNIRHIGAFAFASTGVGTWLREITLPLALNYVGDRAFANTPVETIRVRGFASEDNTNWHANWNLVNPSTNQRAAVIWNYRLVSVQQTHSPIPGSWVLFGRSVVFGEEVIAIQGQGNLWFSLCSITLGHYGNSLLLNNVRFIPDFGSDLAGILNRSLFISNGGQQRIAVGSHIMRFSANGRIFEFSAVVEG